MPPVGMKARAVHAEAVFLDALQHQACFLKYVEAELLAFIDGALSPAGSPVPETLVDEYYLAQAFLNGQEKRRNKYGFALDGRWVYHQGVCKRFQKAGDPVITPPEVCGGYFVDDVRKARHNKGAVDEAFLQADRAPGLQLQSQHSGRALKDAILGPLRELIRRKAGGYNGIRSGISAQATSMRSIPGTPPSAARSSCSNGPPLASARRPGGEIKEKRTTISDADAAAFRSPSPVPSVQSDS